MKVLLLVLLFLSNDDEIKTLRKYYVKQFIPHTHWSYSIRSYETKQELIKLMRKADISFVLRSKKLPPRLKAIRRKLILELRGGETYQLPQEEEYKIIKRKPKTRGYQCPESRYGIKRYAPEPKVAESPYWADTLKIRNRDVTNEIANLAAQVPPDIKNLMTQPRQKLRKKPLRYRRYKKVRKYRRYNKLAVKRKKLKKRKSTYKKTKHPKKSK